MARFRYRSLAALLTGGLVVALAACSGSSAAVEGTAAPTATVLTGAAAGQVLFERSCASCHGVGGVGSKFTMDSNTIEVPALTYTALSPKYGNQYDTITPRAITQGLDEQGQPLNRMMPRWTIFSDQDLSNLVAYLKTLQ